MPLLHCCVPFLFLPSLNQRSKITPKVLGTSEGFTIKARNEVTFPTILKKFCEELFHLLSRGAGAL